MGWSGCAGRPAEGRRCKSVTVQGLASPTGPKSCAGSREAVSEALTGECVGEVLSGERQIRGADVLRTSRRQHDRRRFRETPGDPASS